MKQEIDWALIPEEEFEKYKLRLELVEQLLDDTISRTTKRELKQDYCRIQKVTERTIRRYVKAYKKKGPRGILFYNPRKKSVRIKDENLRKRIIAMVKELPERDVPQIMRLLSLDENFREKIQTISCRTLYRFLYENEIHDLFGMRFDGINIDYGGNFYRIAATAPFSAVGETDGGAKAAMGKKPPVSPGTGEGNG